ncbi:MAG: helix-turn-helix domain-containing protein, partial [bacterium]|nr:helix-turn-helix domain-containing protein [bacterium]
MNMAYTTNEKLPRLRVLAIRMLETGKSTREVARYFGYAQSTIVKWSKRKNEIWHERKLQTRSCRPHHSPNTLPKEIVAKIIHTRVETKRCAEVVHEMLKKENVDVSLSSVKRTLSRFNMANKRSPWKKRRIYPPRPDIT